MSETIEFRHNTGLTPYPYALEAMEVRVAGILAGTEAEELWFLEHPPLYTAGTSARAEDLLDPRFPVFNAGRGGEYTYHGPGQRVAYLMMDLRRHDSIGRCDLRAYVKKLEQWLIAALAEFGVTGEVREGRIGVWVATPAGEAKIAALGIRIRKWVAFHGIALNVKPDLSHFQGIVPCGIREYGVTSLQALGINASMADVDNALKRTFETTFDCRLTS